MDIDVMGKHVQGLLAFKDKVEGLIKGSDESVAKASDQIDEVLAFKSSFEAALPDLYKAIGDVAVVVDDLGKVKADLAPVLAWIAEQQKAADEAKTKAEAEEKLKAEAAAAAQAENGGHPVAVEASAHEPSAADESGETEQSAG